MSEFKELKLTDLAPSPTNPRTDFNPESLQELAESIKQHGILQPIIVRPGNIVGKAGNKTIVSRYEIVAGERRYRAAVLAGLEFIPVSVRELTDDEVFEIQIVENLERKDVHPMDEAVAFRKMLDSGKYTMQDIAAKVAKTETFVAQRLKLNDLVPELKEDFLKGEFGIGHAVLLSRVGEDEQREVFEDSKNEWNPGYPTVKQLKSELDDEGENLENAIFDIEDPNVFVPAGACTTCPKCSLANPILFPEYEEKVCFDSNCFNTKTQVQLRRNLDQIVKDKPGIVLYIRYFSERTKEIVSFAESLGKTVYQGWGVVSNADEGDEGALEALDMSDFTYNFVTIKSKDGAEVPKSPKDILSSELSDLKSKADRALELDREKIMKRIQEEIIGKEDNILMENSNFFGEEEIPAFLMALYNRGNYDFQKWVMQHFGFKGDSYTWRSLDIYNLFRNLRFSVKDQNEIFRAFVVLNFENSALDFGKNSNAKAAYDYVSQSYPSEIEMFTLEQNDVASKRIAKSDARIAELEKQISGYDAESNIESTTEQSTDFKGFEKITRKKYALNNSYCKNHIIGINPSTPIEVMSYWKQHGELPFDMGSDESNWMYKYFVEYQKRAGVLQSQYFTPPATAERIAELAEEYFSGDRILDACCGFGMLTKPLVGKGFIVQGFDNNAELLKMYAEYTGCISELKDINAYMADGVKWQYVVSNPPYEVKELTQFFKLLYDLLDDDGRAILLLPKGFIDKERPKDLVEALSYFDEIYREDMVDYFARTNVTAEIVVIEKR